MPGRATAAVVSTLRCMASAAPDSCLASKPIDVAVAAIVSGNQAGLRAVAASDGAIVGRAQARFAPLGGGPLMAELMNAPLFAQLRYAGPADTLWRLTGSEVIDMSGPLAVGADVGGRLADPQIRGSLTTNNGRLESQVTGMVIDHVASAGAFLRAAADLQPDQRTDDGRRDISPATARSPSPAARPCSTSRSTRARRCSSTATTSLRGSPARCSSGPTPMAGSFRATSSSTRAASSLAAQALRRRSHSSKSARPASTRKT